MRGWTLTAVIASTIGIAGGCGGARQACSPCRPGTRPSNPSVTCSACVPIDAGQDGSDDRSDAGDAGSAACVPTLPALAWTSPYAAWSRGVPTDPGFFPIAVWLQGSWHATEMADLGVNVYVGNNAGTDTLAASDLATLKGKGIYAIVGQDTVGLANIDDPTIVGWWMTPDEPDNAQDNGMGGYGPPVAPATLVSRYNAYKAADPTRPIYLGLGQGVAFDAWEGRGSNAPPESQYVPAADIIAFDIYPYNNCGGDANVKMTCGQFWLNAFGVDRLRSWSNRGQAVWTDFETTTINAGTSSGPTPAQVRSEVWLALIHGANGVTYFVHTWEPTFREDGIFANTTMVSAVKTLNQQVKSLAPVLNSANVPNVVSVASSTSAAPVDLMTKAQGQVLYVFAAIARSGTATGTFTIAGMTGAATATVVGESRTVDVVAGKWSDDFAANGAHIYEIDLTGARCP
ncbi:MAG TPA: hypothetical protein VN903_36085 [Polyangia bacterium]|nr:hypothetical protein [Polyangia bacterium]